MAARRGFVNSSDQFWETIFSSRAIGHSATPYHFAVRLSRFQYHERMESQADAAIAIGVSDTPHPDDRDTASMTFVGENQFGLVVYRRSNEGPSVVIEPRSGWFSALPHDTQLNIGGVPTAPAFYKDGGTIGIVLIDAKTRSVLCE